MTSYKDLYKTPNQRKGLPGWLVIAAGAFLLFTGANFQYTFGVFVKPLINHFGWSRAAISLGATARSFSSALASPIAGSIADKNGPRKVILFGVLCVAISYLLTSQITAQWQLYLFFGVLSGIGMGCVMVAVISAVARWFGKRSSLANGLTMSGMGWAQIVVPPVVTLLIVSEGWENTTIILGIAVAALAIPTLIFFRAPSNYHPQPAAAPKAEPARPQTSPVNDFTLKEAMRTPAFWMLLAVLSTGSACYQIVTTHIVANAIDLQATPEAAAIALMLSGVTNALGRIGLGGLANKIGNQFVLALSLALQSIGLFVLSGANTLNVIYIGSLIHGLGYGGMAPMMPSIPGSFFGTKHIGSLVGAANMSYTIGGGIGPFLAGYIFDITGSYHIAFVAASALTGAGFLVCLVLRPPRRDK